VSLNLVVQRHRHILLNGLGLLHPGKGQDIQWTKVFIQSGLKGPLEPLNDVLTNTKVLWHTAADPRLSSTTRHSYAAHGLDERTAEISGRVLASCDSSIPVASGQNLQRR